MKRLIFISLLFVFLMLFSPLKEAAAQETYVSAQSGNFSEGSTWVGGSAPTEYNHILIKSGHTVTLDRGTDWNDYILVWDVTIEEGAVLNNNGYPLWIRVTGGGATPQYKNDGTHNGPGTMQAYENGDMRIDGNGTINLDIEYHLQGKLQVRYTCNLIINGNIQPTQYGFAAPNVAQHRINYEVFEGVGGVLTVNGDIYSAGNIINNKPVWILIPAEGTLIVDGNIYFNGDSDVIHNKGSLTITGDLTLGPLTSSWILNGSYNMNEPAAYLEVGGDILGGGLCYFRASYGSYTKFGGQLFPAGFGGQFQLLQPTAENTFEYAGAEEQSIIGSLDYQNLIINNSSSEGVSLAEDINVNQTLTLEHGRLHLGDHNLLLDGEATIAGEPGPENMIVATSSGELRKSYDSPASFSFPVGDADEEAEYSPVTIELTSGSFSNGYVGLKLSNQAYPGGGAHHLKRYWEITSSGIEEYSSNLSFRYNEADVEGNEEQLYCYRVEPDEELFAAANTELHELTAEDVSQFGLFTGKSQPNPDAPTAYNVTGGGEYCEGEPGLEVGLDNSEADAIYTLYQNNQPIITDVQGTGSALSFGLQSQGVYTVSGTNDNGTTLMLGEANIIESAYITPEVAISTASTTVCEGEEITIVAVAQGTGQEPLFEWFVNGLSAGENSDTYSYIPQDQDVVQLQMTSSSGCATVNPVMSNEIIFQVIATIIPTAEISASPAEVCQGEEMEFTATVSGAGDTPIFQWFVNGEAMSIAEPVMTFVPNHGDAVQLILSSSASCASPATVESNIVEAVVYELPEVSWETFKPDTFCIFWDAVAITGGLPEGGEYSGPGVADNTFDPEEAGIGEHELTYSYTTDQGCTAQASHIVFVDYCTSLSQSDESKQEIRIYPNPASHELHLDLNGTAGECRTITIYNNLGIAMHRMINPAAKQKHTITLSNWPDGIYHISFDLDSDMISKQFILSK